jgi:hypothetical protein
MFEAESQIFLFGHFVTCFVSDASKSLDFWCTGLSVFSFILYSSVSQTGCRDTRMCRQKSPVCRNQIQSDNNKQNYFWKMQIDNINWLLKLTMIMVCGTFFVFLSILHLKNKLCVAKFFLEFGGVAAKKRLRTTALQT